VLEEEQVIEGLEQETVGDWNTICLREPGLGGLWSQAETERESEEQLV